MSENLEKISPSELKDLLENKETIKLIDVRSFNEFKQKHIASSYLIPLPELAVRLEEIEESKNIVIMCKSATRSKQAYNLLKNKGINARYLEGGIENWQKSGYPVIGSNKTKLTVEEQTRIAIGSLVLLGLLIPFLWWLPWFVAIMLIYAGISGNCFMMNFLAAMPWNKDK